VEKILTSRREREAREFLKALLLPIFERLNVAWTEDEDSNLDHAVHEIVEAAAERGRSQIQ